MSLENNTSVTEETSASSATLNGTGKSSLTNGKKPRSTHKRATPSQPSASKDRNTKLMESETGDENAVSKAEFPEPAVVPSVDADLEIGVEDLGAIEVATPAREDTKVDHEEKEEAPGTFAKPYKQAIELTAAKLIELLKKSGVIFFHNEHGNPFVWVPAADGSLHFECLPLGSSAFKARLVQLSESYATQTTPVGVINEVIKAGELLAFKEQKRNLANRHRSSDGQIAIDLGDPNWHMVTVSASGWELCTQSEAMFFRPQHLKPLPEPIRGGDPFELFDYVSVESNEDKLLVLCWATSALIPDVPSPILNLTGIQGSAKTTKSKRLRDLTDPSVTPVLGDMELSNLFLTFQHHAVPSFENVSKFDRRTADMFCRAVTGNGVERRKLFTNSDQVLYSFRRPIIINGIDTPSTRPDFLDRCIVINCQRIKSFRPLKELDEAFTEARPRLFGALLDLLAKTLKHLPETPPSGEFRMADFAHFGRALAVALGKIPEDFDNAYRSNIRQQDKEALDATPLTIAIQAFAKKHSEKKPWTGSAQALLGELGVVAKQLSDTNVLGDLPKSARWLSSKLGELVTALATSGVIVDRLPRTSSARGWKIWITDAANEVRRSEMTPDQKIADDADNRDLFSETDDDEEVVGTSE